MRTIRTIQALRAWRRQQEGRKKNIGFVPTMGAFHAGHRALIQRARRTSQTLVVSIFVNPLQFGPSEDFRRYPRDLSQDLTLCREEDVDIVFIPQLEHLYPSDFQTNVTVTTLTQRWEGEHRPTHFQGVTTIVTKLLNLVHPTQTYLGQKDYQQFLVIRQLVKDLELNTRLTLCPTIRDSNGLALSSRNQYLTRAQHHQASVLYKALLVGKQTIRIGQRSSKLVCRSMNMALNQERHVTVDYLACCDALTLDPLPRLQGKVVLLGAIRIRKIRLIDNLILQIPSDRVS